MAVARLGVAGAVLVAGLSLAGDGATAHTLEEAEAQLSEREHYLQVVERAAPEFTLRDAYGRTVELAEYRGKSVVLWFVFASCTDVCPLHSQVIATIQDEVNRTPMRDQVEFVAITTDPARDTPDVLTEYGAAQGLDPHNWVFLTTRPDQPEDATRVLAERYGLKFVPGPDGDQMHGLVTHLIDRDGIMRARYHGLKFDTTNLILHLNALTHEHSHAVTHERTLLERARSLLPW